MAPATLSPAPLHVFVTGPLSVCVCVCVSRLGGAVSAMSLAQRRVIKGVMKLMTCYSCDWLLGPDSSPLLLLELLEPTGLHIQRDTGPEFILGGGLVPDTLSTLPPTFTHHHLPFPNKTHTHTHLITSHTTCLYGARNNCWSKFYERGCLSCWAFAGNSTVEQTKLVGFFFYFKRFKHQLHSSQIG